jgi:sulfite exporter TauE/SafE
MLHHSGRLTTYATFGAVSGAIGHAFSLAGYQQIFSITLGTLTVFSVVLVWLGRSTRIVEPAIGRVSVRFAGWIHATGLGREKTRFLLGMANGLLPCTMVYLASLAAANTYTPWDGALFMLAFGVGTIPALLALTWLDHLLPSALGTKLRKLAPVIVLVTGLLLITRGLNLGLPYLSPGQQTESALPATCQ